MVKNPLQNVTDRKSNIQTGMQTRGGWRGWNVSAWAWKKYHSVESHGGLHPLTTSRTILSGGWRICDKRIKSQNVNILVQLSLQNPKQNKNSKTERTVHKAFCCWPWRENSALAVPPNDDEIQIKSDIVQRGKKPWNEKWYDNSCWTLDWRVQSSRSKINVYNSCPIKIRQQQTLLPTLCVHKRGCFHPGIVWPDSSLFKENEIYIFIN